jgi:hypothetical protein
VGDGAGLGVSIGEAGADKAMVLGAEGGTEAAAGSAATPDPVAAHAVTVADAHASMRTPRWRSFRFSDIRQSKAFVTPLVTKS